MNEKHWNTTMVHSNEKQKRKTVIKNDDETQQ